MLKRHYALLAIIVSLILLVVATLIYPGGSMADKTRIGFDWKRNYISNLFSAKSISGNNSFSPFLAIPGMLSLSLGFALFYIDFSKKITEFSARAVIKYSGIFSVVFAFLAVTPFHDSMITIADTLSLVSMFYITVYVFKSKLLLAKIVCVINLAILYFCTYVYYTQNLLYALPILQKLTLLITIIWMLYLHYQTRSEDFAAERSNNNREKK